MEVFGPTEENMIYKLFRRIPGEGTYAMFAKAFNSLEEVEAYLQENQEEFDLKNKIYIVGQVRWVYQDSVTVHTSHNVYFDGKKITLSVDRGANGFDLGEEGDDSSED